MKNLAKWEKVETVEQKAHTPVEETTTTKIEEIF